MFWICLYKFVLNGYLVGWGLGLAVFDGLGVVHSPWKIDNLRPHLVSLENDS
jgi:hypothetical protein